MISISGGVSSAHEGSGVLFGPLNAKDPSSLLEIPNLGFIGVEEFSFYFLVPLVILAKVTFGFTAPHLGQEGAL